MVSGGSGAAVTVQDNIVTGEGGITYIAQNGIQISFGATARVFGNTVTANNYLPAKVTVCGLLIYKAGICVTTGAMCSPGSRALRPAAGRSFVAIDRAKSYDRRAE